MRNKKAYDYEYDAWNASCAGNPAYPSQDYRNYEYNWPWDDGDDYYGFFENDQVFRSSILSKHVIKNSNRDYIRLQLSSVKRNSNCRNLFEDIIAGNFCITVQAETLFANKYYIDNLFRYSEHVKGELSISIYELDGENLMWISPDNDDRFSMTSWSKKFDYQNSVFSLNELIEIIAHCVRLGRVASFL